MFLLFFFHLKTVSSQKKKRNRFFSTVHVQAEQRTSTEVWQRANLKPKYLEQLITNDKVAQRLQARQGEIVELVGDWKKKVLYLEQGVFTVGKNVYKEGSFIMTLNLLDLSDFDSQHTHLLQQVLAEKKSKYFVFKTDSLRSFLEENPLLSHKFFRYIACQQADRWMNASILYTEEASDKDTQDNPSNDDEVSLDQITHSFVSSFGIVQEPVLYHFSGCYTRVGVVKHFGRLILTTEHVAFLSFDKEKWIISYSNIASISSNDNKLVILWKFSGRMVRQKVRVTERDQLHHILQILRNTVNISTERKEKAEKRGKLAGLRKQAKMNLSDLVHESDHYDGLTIERDSSTVNSTCKKSEEYHRRLLLSHKSLENASMSLYMDKLVKKQIMSDLEMQMLKSPKFVKYFKAKELIIPPGEIRKIELLIIASGSCEVLFESVARTEGNGSSENLESKATILRRIRVLRETEMFGMEALLLGKCNSKLLVKAKEACVVYLVPLWYLRQMFKQNSPFAAHFFEYIATKLAEEVFLIEEKLESFVCKKANLRTRILKQTLDTLKKIGVIAAHLFKGKDK